MKEFKILIAAGGTGGHLFPAMAVLEQLEILSNGKTRAHFVGTADRIESRIVPEKGYSFTPMPISGFSGLSLKTLLLPYKIMKSVNICKSIIKSFKPDAVLCTGAYISYPAGIAVSNNDIPLFLMESNVNPGKAIRMLSKKANKIFTSFTETKDFFPSLSNDIVEFIGNPVRNSLLSLPDKKSARMVFNLDQEKKTILVFGGSLGARSINSAIENNFDYLSKLDAQILWQTGRSFVSNKSLPKNIVKCEFIDDMASAYSAADIVVSRSGATSVAEICVCGKASILVPLPSASNNEQRENAKALARANAAIVIDDSDVSTQLIAKIEELLANPSLSCEMGKNALLLAKPSAALDCARKILQFCNY